MSCIVFRIRLQVGTKQKQALDVHFIIFVYSFIYYIQYYTILLYNIIIQHFYFSNDFHYTQEHSLLYIKNLDISYYDFHVLRFYNPSVIKQFKPHIFLLVRSYSITT